jgi:hypothetical protein
MQMRKLPYLGPFGKLRTALGARTIFDFFSSDYLISVDSTAFQLGISMIQPKSGTLILEMSLINGNIGGRGAIRTYGRNVHM